MCDIKQSDIETIIEGLEDAIGVCYKKETELDSHYYDCRAAAQFDAVCYFRTTSALELM